MTIAEVELGHRNELNEEDKHCPDFQIIANNASRKYYARGIVGNNLKSSKCPYYALLPNSAIGFSRVVL